MRYLLFIFLFFIFSFPCKSQERESDKFTISGEIIGKDTGVVVLQSTNIKDTVALRKGKFRFAGQVNGISDAYLWTDTSNHNFSDHSVVRFLLEPGDLFISYQNGKTLVKGSRAEDEKKRFDIFKAKWTIPQRKILNAIDSLYNSCNYHTDSITRGKINKLNGELSIINRQIMPLDVHYISTHPDSFLSAFLLSSYKRKLSIDTLQRLYNSLNVIVKSSSEGRKVLEHIYPLTNDISFRNNNPLMGNKMNDSLVNALSIYDLSSRDTSGNIVDFKIFQGKYLLIDFWASWCGPCIKNLPYFESLKKIYPSDKINFISISLDIESNDWQKAVEKYKLTGYQFSDLRGFNGLLPVYCKVALGIPQYILVNNDGKIINYNAPFPNDPQLGKIINDLLK